MKGDIIDLVSDGEESCGEDSKDAKTEVTTRQLDKHNDASRPSMSEKAPFDEKQTCLNAKATVQQACASQPSASTKSSFLGGNVSVRKDARYLQVKDLTRRFWKAGDYEMHPSSSHSMPNGMDHVRVHPKFLHSNATSHKWALGAIAELLDNAIDEVANGATYVSIDKVMNIFDNTVMLQIQDDGGGMNPDNMRHCMSLGYSRKASTTTIGQYGNGFKTSTMRLGADVIVFSRCTWKSFVTQSIGLLSYTFLRATGHEDIVVPMVDFDLSQGNGKMEMLVRSTEDDWLNNLSIILQWSPFTSEEELLKQFDDIGLHGTKIIVYNLWMNDDGELELDFDSDKEDIQVRGVLKVEKSDSIQKEVTSQHIMNRLRYSLRAYSSILYLRMPSNFQIILRGTVVEHLSIADDLKFPERILYKPQIGNSKDLNSREVSVITTIGFAKEAPMVNVHGFNVYHKNRLIMPFWKVFQENSSRGRGVVGVLEANFIEPAHDKQDFERTPILQRLETRLKQMTIEYWNLHCDLIGYQPPKHSSKYRYSNGPGLANMEIPGTKTLEASNNLVPLSEIRQGETSAPSTPPQPGSDLDTNSATGMDQKPPVTDICTGGKLQGQMWAFNTKANGSILGKRGASDSCCLEVVKHKKASVESTLNNHKDMIVFGTKSVDVPTSSNLDDILEELQHLRARCIEYEQQETELKLEMSVLKSQLLEYKQKYDALTGKQPELRKPKEEW